MMSAPGVGADAARRGLPRMLDLRLRLTGLLALALCAQSRLVHAEPSARQQPGAAQPAAKVDRAAAPLAAAKKALAEGRKDAALVSLAIALSSDPASIEALKLYVEANAGDDDARTFWQHTLARATLGPKGTLSLDANATKRLNTGDARPVQLSLARAAAVEELVRFAREREKEGSSRPESLLVARWARRVALDLASRSSALLAANANELSPRLSLPESLPTKAVRALEAFANSALANSRTRTAVEAARILAGLAQQEGWDDLQGPRPAGLGSLEKSSAEILRKARTQLASHSDQPWTIDELLALDPEQAEAFTRAHDSFGSPGVAVSPQGWYRIETDCGYATLLGTAQTIEKHHQRLARWYGTDPFVNRPGLVRIVPEATGLEAEGAPFWWAGGFQGGDTTTLRFSCGESIDGLGHGLTHELTHRFDGALFPGSPAWLMEGKAVWTGGAFGASGMESFVENYASLGTIENAYVKGYGDPEKLTKLIDGTIDDYRDNYVAGNALYVYLRSRKSPGGRVLFREQLLEFQKRARGPKKGKELFTSCFCDGREERPKTFEAFCADWTPWVAGFYWQDRKPWALEFTEDVGPQDYTSVLDEPVWGWSRNRAEPRFGQEQAVIAARLLLASGQRADAITALVWALAVDGRRPDDELVLANALTQESKADAAWCLRAELGFPHGERPGAPPFKGLLPKTFAFADALDAAANDARSRSLTLTSASLRADRERLASWLGLAASKADEPLDTSSKAVLFDGPSSALAASGWSETGLTDYEERRVKGLWCVDEEGNLVVGRAEPRPKKIATGGGIETVDRAAAQVSAFALAPEWILPGTWQLDCRIRFQTSFVSGAVVFGYVDRDVNLRFSFSAGDFNYAIGASEKQEHDFKSISGWLSGLRERDPALIGDSTGGSIEFDAPRSSFHLRLLVDAGLVRAFIEGKPAGVYHTVDGAPIEGQIGFATSMGVMQVEDLRVTRLDRSRLAPALSFEVDAFDLASTRSLEPWRARNRPGVGLPRHPQGTLVYWVPPPDVPMDDKLEHATYVSKLQRGVRDLATFLKRNPSTQPLIVALPAALDADGRASVEAEIRKELGEKLELRTHPHHFDLSTDVGDDAKKPPPRGPWLLFADQAGTLRAVLRLSSFKPPGTDAFVRWLEVFREHGRPPRELPSFERPKSAPGGATAPGEGGR